MQQSQNGAGGKQSKHVKVVIRTRPTSSFAQEYIKFGSDKQVRDALSFSYIVRIYISIFLKMKNGVISIINRKIGISNLIRFYIMPVKRRFTTNVEFLS